MKKYISFIIITLFIAGFFSCKEFLNVVPDNVATIDNAFTNQADAERYLFTCYSYAPREPDVYTNPAMCGGDEFWLYWPLIGGGHIGSDPILIARGGQNASAPYLNYWNGDRSGLPLYKGIRDCNIFLENIDKTGDLDPAKKTRWVAEVKFLKAYYHFYLLRMYGPISITDVNIPITAETPEVKVYRDPFDKTVDYIIGLLDEASPDLPSVIQNRTSELGRITKAIALAVKAKILVTVASPLFNGNTDYQDMKGTDGSPLMNPTFDNQKWQRAATACQEAITACEVAGNKLYGFNPALVNNISDTLIVEMSIRNSVCEKWNPEIIWGSTNGSTVDLQRQCMVRIDPAKLSNEQVFAQLAPPLKIVEMFYSKNGVPITEDITWDAANQYKVKTAPNTEHLQSGYQTAGLNINREPRFYADLAFDGSKWFMQNGNWNIQAKSGQAQARKNANSYSVTGYFTKKLVNWKFELTDNIGGLSIENYSWPIMRMADLYLLYAEALNEAKGPAEPDVLIYLNKIRKRAGLNTVEQSWTTYSNNPAKFTTKDGLRAIIHQERLIEMAFEGSRFWDLRRWKDATETLNQTIYGWDINEETSFNYYKRIALYTQSFVSPRDYLWPIKTDEIIINRNIVQNTGW